MCKPASFVLTRDAVYFSKTSNSHEDIIREHGLPDGQTSAVSQFRDPLILRVEISPPGNNFSTDPARWLYKVDQDRRPVWADEAEKRVRAVLPEWLRYHCCSQTGVNLLGGFQVEQKSGDNATQKAGIDAIQTAEYGAMQMADAGAKQTAGANSTQTAGDFATQWADDFATQTAGDGAKQTARDGATQKAYVYADQKAGNRATQTAGSHAVQVAGSVATQTAQNHSNQTAGNYAVQTADYRATQKAGDYSIQKADEYATQTAGVGTVQIIRWFQHCWHTVTRIVTVEEANKTYEVDRGVWTLVENANV